MKIDKTAQKAKKKRNPNGTTGSFTKFQVDIESNLKNWTTSLAKVYSLTQAWEKRITSPDLNSYFKYFCRLKDIDFDKLSATKTVPKALIDHWGDTPERDARSIRKSKFPVNEVVISESEKVEKDGKIIKDVNTIVQKKISAISFSSPATINTINRIHKSTEYKDLYMKDFLYYHGGGTDDFEELPDGNRRKRFKDNLDQIQLAKDIKEDLKTLYIDLKETTDQSEIKAIRDRVRTLNLILDSVVTIELQPFNFFQKLADDDYSSQKIINGAIINDRAMIDNGNIELVEGKDKVIKANTDEDLKRINTALMNKQLEDLTIENPSSIIIDAE